jgi:hypothetical protein
VRYTTLGVDAACIRDLGLTITDHSWRENFNQARRPSTLSVHPPKVFASTSVQMDGTEEKVMNGHEGKDDWRHVSECSLIVLECQSVGIAC